MAGEASESGGMTDRLKMLEEAVDALPIGMGILQRDGRTVLLNRRFREIYGMEGDEVAGMSFDDMAEQGLFDNWKEDPEAYFERLGQALAAGQSFSAEVEMGDKIIAVHDVPLGDDLLLTTQQDITARVKAERSVAYLAHHDSLTDLPNRTSFLVELGEQIGNAKAKNEPFAVLSVDLDRFKDVNDIFGHAVGDALLVEVAERFRETADGARAARLGGDEFCFIVTGRQPTRAATLAERILERVSGDATIDGRHLLVSLSIGVAIYPADGHDAATLLNNADAALYRAKADGRGVIRFYEKAMDERIHQHRQLQQDLRVAVRRNELSLFYQPQATMDGTIVGFEALARWKHPTLGDIEPTEFVPLAEENGLIVEIGEWILRQACSEAASWSNPLEISVNVSPVQFRHGDLPATIHTILLETGLSPTRLEVEITEGVLIENHTRALDFLRRIKALGVRVAMDDFGTGYSSLSYLQSFPFDKLKIDQSFVDRVETDHHAKEIVRAVIGLGRSLKVPTIAEGVETEAQFAFLSDAQCNGVQGYFIGRPEPINWYADVTGGDMTFDGEEIGDAVRPRRPLAG